MKKTIHAVALGLALLSVTFELAIAQLPQKQEIGAAVSLSQPRKEGELVCAPNAGAIFRCLVAGAATGVLQTQMLLLWVRPVKPRSESAGWYLQRGPNGVFNQSGNSWDGKIQIGNREYPPHDGDVIDVAISIADAVVADKLMRAAGVEIDLKPVGVVVAKSENVRVHIPTRR